MWFLQMQMKKILLLMLVSHSFRDTTSLFLEIEELPSRIAAIVWHNYSKLLKACGTLGSHPKSSSIPRSPGEGRKQKGMILPFQPLTMTFHNVNYYVDMPPV